MILGLVPNVYKDMEPRRALQKELKELQDSKVPEQWDEATETRFLRRRRWTAVLAILSVVLGSWHICQVKTTKKLNPAHHWI